MTGIINYPYFIVSSILLIISPGLDFVYVLTRGVAEGKKAGVLSALGIGIGLLVHTCFAALGLSAVVKTSEWLYNLVKVTGAIYLIYLGIKTIVLLKKTEAVTFAEKKQKHALKQGILTNLMNPKTIVVFLAYLPQFVHPVALNPVRDLLLLGITLTLLAVSWFVFLGYFSGSVGLYIQKNKRVQIAISRASGIVMIVLGLQLFF